MLSSVSRAAVFQSGQGRLEHALLQVRLHLQYVHKEKVRIYVERGLVVLESRIVPSLEVVHAANIGTEDDRERIH